MNLTDLQIELRAIEEHIEALHTEIEKMKPKTEEEKKTEFEQITEIAEKNRIVNQSILGAPMEIKKLIFSSMAYILLSEEQDLYDRILYLCRLSKGCGFEASAEDLYKIGLEFDMSDLHRLCTDIADYKYPYFVELLIMANLSEEASNSILSIIADLVVSFGVSKEEIQVLGMVAKSVLIHDMDYMLNMPVPSRNMWSGKLKDYITEEWNAAHRVSCGMLCIKKDVNMTGGNQTDFYLSADGVVFATTSGQSEQDYSEENLCEIKNCLQAGSLVKKGDIICTYTEKELKKYDKKSGFMDMIRELTPENITVEKTIVAPCNGVVYYNNKSGAVKGQLIEYIAVYVVSYFDDYTEFSTRYKTKFNVCHK